MATLTPFDQGELLVGVTDPAIRNGICVALCDMWLHLVRDSAARSPRERVAAMRAQAPKARQYQAAYAQRREIFGRVEARQQMGRRHGHDFEELTTVFASCVGVEGMHACMARDLEGFGASATWSIEVPGWGRHALAGFRGLESLSNNVHRASVHIFDPNIGEYVCEPHQIRAVLRDLFKRDPNYARITQISRMST
jgi:hypothetical protein